jgi:peptide deformylase
MVYPIVVYGDPVLKKKGKNIEEGSDYVKILSEDMFETMRNANGVGLAAPQIGKSIRMFIVDATAMEDEELGEYRQVFINPEIIEESGEEWGFEEGCLSIPDIREDIYRQEKVRIRYFDENWKEKEEEFDGIIARVIQHEFDHIEGILFTDHLTPLKRRLLKGKLTNISKGKVETSYRILAPLAKI